MKNFTITEIWGIPIRVNISLVLFLPILVWIIGSGEQISIYSSLIASLLGRTIDISTLRSGINSWIIGILAAIGLFVSVTMHELGHAWAAKKYGIVIDSITLWIFGGIASLQSLPREWDKEFWIAIAGPIASVLVAILCYIVAFFLPNSLPIILFVFGWLAVTNIVLTVFNLVPAFPMDGGRILRAFLSRSMSYSSATQTAARIGIGFAFVFGILGILSFNIILILIAFFIYGAASSESRTVLIDDLLEGLTVKEIASNQYKTVDNTATISELVNRVINERQTAYPVVDENNSVIGLVTLRDIQKVQKKDYDKKKVKDILSDEYITVDENDDAFDIFAKLSTSGSDYALVKVNKEIKGIISQSDFSKALDLQRDLRVAQ